MIIGVCTIELYLPATRCLKDKRRIIKSALDRIRSRYNVSAAEVDSQDSWGKAVVGLAVVSNDAGHARSVLQEAVKVFDHYHGETEVVQLTYEFV